MNKISATFILLLLTPFVSFSQSDSTSNFSKKELRKDRPTYIGITMGLNSSNFRDFATSPLIYNGIQNYIALSRVKYNQKRESEIGLSYFFGKYENTFNEHLAISEVKIFSMYYSQLYRLNKLSSEKWNVKIGGLFHTTSNLRINESLQNNALGIEIFPTLFGSIKIGKDVSRKKAKDRKLLFIRYHLKERTRNLSFRLNLGLINSSFRNGFVYAGQSAILNEEKLFDDYQFKVFSGFRASSSLDYTISLKNKNKIQLSYLWDAYKTGGDLDKFEMAHHTLKLTLLFNTNNK